MTNEHPDQVNSLGSVVCFGLRSAWSPALAVTAVCSIFLWVPMLWLNPEARDPAQAALLLGYLLLFHGLIFVPIAMLMSTGFALTGGLSLTSSNARSLRRCIAATLLGVVVALNAILRFTLSYTVFRAQGQMLTLLGALNLVVFLGVPIVALWGLRPRRDSRRPATALLAVWAGMFVVTCAINLVDERPRSFSISQLSVETAADPDRQADSSHLRPERVALLGFDGLSWYVIDAMLRKGQLPNFELLLQRAARANLRSQIPTSSPMLWTSIATGRPPSEHGIYGFVSFRLPGMREPLERAPTWLSMNWWNGLNRVLSVLGSLEVIEQIPYFGTKRKTPAVWDVAAHHGLTFGVTRWYSTWPVPDLDSGSYMTASYDGRPRAIVPRDEIERVLAEEEVPPLPLPADSPICTEAWLEENATKHQADFHRAMALRRHFRPQLSLDYWHFTDAVQHVYWRGNEHDSLLFISHESRYGEFPPHVTDAYALVDSWLGDFVAELEPETLLLVVSDHGYAFDGHEHHHAPDGILIAAGPGVRPGAVVKDVTQLDIAPTILAALDLPLSDELPGRVLQEMFTDDSQREPDGAHAYEWYRPYEIEAERNIELERKRIEELRALGYVN